jgi:hypothetical protein
MYGLCQIRLACGGMGAWTPTAIAVLDVGVSWREFEICDSKELTEALQSAEDMKSGLKVGLLRVEHCQIAELFCSVPVL